MQDPNVRRAKPVGVTFVVRRLLPPQSKLGPDCRKGHRWDSCLVLDQRQHKGRHRKLSIRPWQSLSLAIGSSKRYRALRQS